MRCKLYFVMFCNSNLTICLSWKLMKGREVARKNQMFELSRKYKSSWNPPDKMPLCILTESGGVCFPTVHCSPVAIIHGQVHLEKLQISVGILLIDISIYHPIKIKNHVGCLSISPGSHGWSKCQTWGRISAHQRETRSCPPIHGISVLFHLLTLQVDWNMPGGICSTVPSLYTINELKWK